MLKPVLQLESYLWCKVLRGKLPSKPWQLAEIVRMNELLRHSTNEFVKNLLPIQKKAFSSGVRKCWVILRKNPELHTDKVSIRIQELYQLLLTNKPSAGVISNQIGKLQKEIETSRELN